MSLTLNSISLASNTHRALYLNKHTILFRFSKEQVAMIIRGVYDLAVTSR
jgi:hypothetical protein